MALIKRHNAEHIGDDVNVMTDYWRMTGVVIGNHYAPVACVVTCRGACYRRY